MKHENGKEDFLAYNSKRTVICEFNRADGSMMAVRLSIQEAKAKVEDLRFRPVNFELVVERANDIQKLEKAIKDAQEYAG